MERQILGFQPDEVGDWVARLDCGHRQHVRHRPPLWPAAWVDDAAERRRRVGTSLPCPLCDRCEIPPDLVVVRTTPTWDESSLPPALRTAHRISSGTWGRLRVSAGRLRFVAHTDPVTDVLVDRDVVQGIPPDVEHYVEPDGPVALAIDFLRPLDEGLT
jgi:tellurite resistance-related uncharacterized protein